MEGNRKIENGKLTMTWGVTTKMGTFAQCYMAAPMLLPEKITVVGVVVDCSQAERQMGCGWPRFRL